MSQPRKYFGTDGVRGLYGGELIHEDFARKLGVATAAFLKADPRKVDEPLVVIGRDTRISGRSLENAIVDGLGRHGIQVCRLGVVPTPVVSFAVRKRKADLGIVITASHNPAADNGIKFFSSEGVKLSDADEGKLEEFLETIGAGVPEPAGAPAGEDASEDLCSYRRLVASILPNGALTGWRIVLDTANGTTFQTSPGVLSGLGAELFVLGANPNGHNINDGVGSNYPDLLARTTVQQKALIGIAHDGDGDRVILCDENGEILDGDEIMAITALHALRKGTLRHNILVATVYSNLGLDEAMNAAGGKVVRCGVGDRQVAEAMRASGAVIGGENSGHLIYTDISPTGDGLAAALKIISIMRETGNPLSKLRSCMRKFPQKMLNVAMKHKPDLSRFPAVGRTVSEIEAGFNGRGRVFIRYSGTEPKLRIMVESGDESKTDEALERLAGVIRQTLPVA